VARRGANAAHVLAPTDTDAVEDYISGVAVSPTPEEINAVQVFAKRLVADYGYPKAHIQTRPQYRVRKSPSDDKKTFPIDIAVFSSNNRLEDELQMVVECKRPRRKEGLAQLKLYLDMSTAEIGVWFNGSEHAYIRKVHHASGRRTYQELPNIPRYGQRVEDIGLYCRRELKKPSNLKAVFRDIRNHLAGNTTGITRDESLAQEIINLLFCKIYDEINTAPDEMVSFRCGVDETAKDVRKRIVETFEFKVKREYSDVFTSKDAVTLDAASLMYVVGELQTYCIIDADRDAVGDAFEVFIGPALRGAEGQFFTPRNVIKLIVDMIDPEPGDLLIDPACGSGGFLIAALEHVWGKLEREGKKKEWSEVILDRKKRELASRCFRGLDKDSFLAKVTKAYMAIIGDGRGGVFCENALMRPDEWRVDARDRVRLGRFNVVMTNPPFGSKIPVKGAQVLAQYELGYKWSKDKKSQTISKSDKLRDEQAPHILFLERCLQLLVVGGRLGIVMPESILGNPSYEYVINYLMERTTIRAIVTMPESLFKTSGKSGTHTKVAVMVLEKTEPRKTHSMFFGAVKWCGHDSRGNPTYRRDPSGRMVLLDEVPTVAARYQAFLKGKMGAVDHLSFKMPSTDVRNRILVPQYYDPEIEAALQQLSKTHDLVTVGNLVDARILAVETGTEIGKMAYGTGRIPFIRTSDLSNWEIKADFKHGVSRSIYESEKRKAEVAAGDILLVRDGTYLIGTTAIVTDSDLPMLYQSHIYRLRVLKPKDLDPWLLLACLNTSIVMRQIRAKQFTQDIIDTLGRRVHEIVLPLPRSLAVRKQIGDETRETISMRVKLRNRVQDIARKLEGRTDDNERDSSVQI
jgi:type I restriction enzyme M protein